MAADSGEKPFTGRDAAFVDWSWKNCNFVGSAKERDLLDHLTPGNRAAFEKDYEAQSNLIASQAGSEQSIRARCEEIKRWYGAEGSRIPGIVFLRSDPLAGVTNAPDSSGGAQKSGGGRRGKRGGQ